jgi:undecaprenyl-diphosphatase
MDIGYAVFKGVLQGLTEFLPVSSTAHLVLTDHWWPIITGQAVPSMAEAEFFDIMLHLGTLSAVLWYYRQSLPGLFTGKSALIRAHQPIWVLVGLSTVVTVSWILLWLKGSGAVFASLGWVTPVIENLSDLIMATPTWVACHLLVTGTLLYWTEHQRKQAAVSGAQLLKPASAAWIGLAQGCAAIFHGLSRSGSTISMGLLTGLDRVTATQYAFILSIPTFILATVYECLKLSKLGHIDRLDWPVMGVGMVLSAVVGYICIKAFLQFVGKYPLTGFAIYCWVVGLLMLISFSALPHLI